MRAGVSPSWTGAAGQVPAGRGWSGTSVRCRMGVQPKSSPVEDIMFRTKSRKEQLTGQVQDQSDSLASTAAMVADQLRGRVVPAVGHHRSRAREGIRLV